MDVAPSTWSRITPRLFEGVRYAIGEVGGFTFYVGERKLYPIMVAEKQMCWMKATLRGRGGHGSMPLRGQAMGKMADLLQRLDRHRLPVHVTPVARQMIEDMASVLPPAQRLVLRQLLNHRLTRHRAQPAGFDGRGSEPAAAQYGQPDHPPCQQQDQRHP